MEDSSIALRRCSRCAEVKPLLSFVGNGVGKFRYYCKVCQAIRCKQPERAEKEQKRREANSGYLKEWKAKNPDRVAAYGRKQREKNPCYRPRASRKGLETPEQRRAAWAKHYAKHRSEEIAKASLKKRARRLKIKLTYFKYDRDEIARSQNYICPYCKCTFQQFHLDHVIPLSRGGAHTRENMVAACVPCNLRKSNKTPEEFMSN